MSPQEAPSQTPLIPSDRVDELAQLIKDSSVTPMFALKINEERTPSLTSTKLGGLPYWPQGMDYPTTKKGIKLMLLAQLNLGDFGDCNMLPGTGLLQFFVRQSTYVVGRLALTSGSRQQPQTRSQPAEGTQKQFSHFRFSAKTFTTGLISR